jgi:mono/diheme cytochrome c family protein
MVLAMAMVALPTGAVMVQAQDAPAVAAADPAAVERGLKVWKGQDCTGCHGWAGNGERIGENPTGPSLRALTLDATTIREIILCGRPGSEMPYHDMRAYTDDRCYGLVKADIEGERLLKGKPMTSEEADDIVAYMMNSMVGRPDEANQDDCRAYYGGKPFCANYPTAASQGL